MINQTDIWDYRSSLSELKNILTHTWYRFQAISPKVNKNSVKFQPSSARGTSPPPKIAARTPQNDRQGFISGVLVL